MKCLQCGEISPIITRSGLCPTCDRTIDGMVASIERRLEKQTQLRHYQDLAAAAAAERSARLGRHSGDGITGVESTAPVTALAGGAAP
jgi:hypothetical protein